MRRVADFFFPPPFISWQCWNNSLGHKRRPGNTYCLCRNTQSAANSVDQRTNSSRISGILALSTFQQAFLNRGGKALQVDFLPPCLLLPYKTKKLGRQQHCKQGTEVSQTTYIPNLHFHKTLLSQTCFSSSISTGKSPRSCYPKMTNITNVQRYRM